MELWCGFAPAALGPRVDRSARTSGGEAASGRGSPSGVAAYLAEETDRLDQLILPPCHLRAPALLAAPGVGPDSATLPLIAAGDNPEPLRNEAA